MGAALMGLTACSSDELRNLFSGEDDGRISFTATIDKPAATRAVDLTPIDFDGTQPGRPLVLSATVTDRNPQTATRGVRLGSADDLGNFGVTAIQAAKNVTDEQLATLSHNLFHNLEATKNGETYEVTQDYYWPTTDEKLFFYAYAPYTGTNTIGTGITVASDNVTGPQKLQFTVNSTVTSQVDLVTAASATTAFTNTTGDSKTAAVPLEFQHELCAIRFVIGEQWLAGSIKSVAIRNVHGKGTLTIGSHAWEWKDLGNQNLNASDSFVLTLDKTGIEGTANEEFMTGDFADQYFLMIPQEFDDNSEAYLEVVYQDNAKDYTVTASLKGQTWECNKTVVYAISSTNLTTLKIGDIVWPVTNETQTWVGPKTAFEAGDSIGLYVVDDGGNNIVHSNVKCTYNGSVWAIHHPENSPVYKLPGRQYFFYYPYNDKPDTSYPLQGQGSTNTAATAFFSSIIEGWTPVAVQSNEEMFKKQDLQVGKGVDHATLASTVDVQMAHQMNIGIITLGSKDVANEVTYKLDNTYKWLHGADGTSTNVAASPSFTGNLPYSHTVSNVTKYYYVFKPVTDLGTQQGTKLEASNNTETSDWTYYLQTDARGTKTEKTVYTARATYPVEKNYPSGLAIGDIYYKNGAISHSLITTANNANYGTPVGIVFSTSTSTSDTNAGYKHGYVISTKDVIIGEDSIHAWTTLEDNDVNGIANLSWGKEMDMTSGSGSIITNLNVNGNNGRTNTAAVGTSNDNYPAFKAIGTFNSGTSAISTSTSTQVHTEWYMPSVAEWWLICKNLGGVTNETQGPLNHYYNEIEGVERAYGIYYLAPASNNVRKAINAYIKTVGTGNFEYIHGGTDIDEENAQSVTTTYWTSAECVGKTSMHISFIGGTVGKNDAGNLDFWKVSKTLRKRVRPILAF